MNRIISRVMRLLNPPGAQRIAPLSQQEAQQIEAIKARNLTYLPQAKLASIVETIREIESLRLPGDFHEAGCALGGSTILIVKLKSPARKLSVYDVFDMIPPPTEQDGKDVHKRYEAIKGGTSTGIGGDKYYGYEHDLYQKVLNNLRSFDIDPDEQHVRLIKGLLQDTLRISAPVAFAHIDVDWYEPVKTSLERILPHLVVGGSVILDDYADWSGCRKATDEYLRGRKDQFRRDGSAGSLKITRITN